MDRTARGRLRHLALVESSCRLSSPDDPFSRLPPRAAEIAVRQLDTVLPRHPELRVLRLQLERHLQAHRAHVTAMLALEERKWQIEGTVASVGASLALDSMIGGPWGVTDFLETRPFERASLGTCGIQVALSLPDLHVKKNEKVAHCSVVADSMDTHAQTA